MTTSNWTPRRSARWIWLTLGSVVLVSCCVWSGLIWMLPGLPNAWANRLDHVQGKAELLIPAERRPSAGLLSPDGRRLLISWMQDDQVQIVVWDLANNQQHPLTQYVTAMRWLNATHTALIGEGYHVIDTRDFTSLPAEDIPLDTYFKPGGFATVEPLLKRADHVYIFESFGGGAGYKAFVQEATHWSVVILGYGFEFGMTRDDLEAQLADIPHIRVPTHGWGRVMGTKDRVYSPNGQYYTTREGAKGDARVVIYTRAGVKVAEAAKGGWGPDILGWAHDSSGVYFQQWISGSAAAVLLSAKPLFKLSPLTAEEARWAVVQQVGAWGGVALALFGMGYVVVRRKVKGKR
jgi:hypothetical protein